MSMITKFFSKSAAITSDMIQAEIERAEGEIVTEHPGFGFREGDIQVDALWEWTVSIGGFEGPHGKALVPEGNEVVLQEPVGVSQG